MAKQLCITVIAGFLTTLLLLSGCSSVTPHTVPFRSLDKGSQIVSISKEMLGVPYRYGGESPRGFDCSGLVRYVCRQIGIKVPHSSRMLYQQSKRIPLNKLQPGDLLFFKINGDTISHVAIYTQNRKFIHAPSSGKTVSIASLDSSYWSKRLAGAGRFW